jgi:pyrroloquinoline quinone biosynthesis protein B
LVNASPDFSTQALSFPPLHPDTRLSRNSPIAGVFLTNADLDHLLGSFSLREGNAAQLYATRAVRTTAEESLGLETVLNSFCGCHWHDLVYTDFEALDNPDGGEPTLSYRAIELPGAAPRFARKAEKRGQSVAYQFRDNRTRGLLLVAPDVSVITDDLRQALGSSDAVLFDGTFWSAQELGKVRAGAPAASDMGHVTIEDCSLKLLSGLPARIKIYIHINNTNPILATASHERAAVEAGGITVGTDGLEFEL